MRGASPFLPLLQMQPPGPLRLDGPRSSPCRHPISALHAGHELGSHFFLILVFPLVFSVPAIRLCPNSQKPHPIKWGAMGGEGGAQARASDKTPLFPVCLETPFRNR